MTYAQMFKIMDEVGLSPEAGAKLLGISGMSLRRWRELNQSEELPFVYARAFEAAVYDMVAKGTLSAEAPEVQSIMEKANVLPMHAALRNLGMSKDILEGGQGGDTLVAGLAQIGRDEERRKEVEQSLGKMPMYIKLGAEWKERVQKIVAIIKSNDLTLADKLVAYGALFYLITPLDFIPDTIPVIGLLDDFAVLGLALAYYAHRAKKKKAQSPPKDT